MILTSEEKSDIMELPRGKSTELCGPEREEKRDFKPYGKNGKGGKKRCGED